MFFKFRNIPQCPFKRDQTSSTVQIRCLVTGHFIAPHVTGRRRRISYSPACHLTDSSVGPPPGSGPSGLLQAPLACCLYDSLFAEPRGSKSTRRVQSPAISCLTQAWLDMFPPWPPPVLFFYGSSDCASKVKISYALSPATGRTNYHIRSKNGKKP